MGLPAFIGYETKRQHKPFLFLLVLTILSFPVFSQPNRSVLDKLARQLNTRSKNAPSELIYLQTSKGIYEAGEDLWFKAYLLNAQTFTPSLQSLTLYLQLVSEATQKAVWQQKYETGNGAASGQVYLPDTLSEADYLLEAFTAHSFYNDSAEFKAVRKVRVIKDIKSLRVRNVAMAPKPRVFVGKDIQFGAFPEGGRLISGIPGRLALKAVDTAGRPIAISGALFENGRPLQEFKSVYAGMGSLTFTPLSGKKYYIRLKEPAIDSTFLLPEVYSQGMSLRLAARDSSYLEFIVSQSQEAEKRTIYLRGQLRGITYCMAGGVLDKEAKIRIPLKEFPQQGIAEFTLFNENLLPVAERLVYVHPEKRLYIKAELSKQQYERREKAVLKIKVSDEKGQPVTANLGISVYDKLYQNLKDPENILTHCYLFSQLKGRIYDPAYYFDEKNKGREEALDLLLLTQGWRNYVWSEENLAGYKQAQRPAIFDGTAGEVHFTKKLKQAPKGGQFVMAFTPDEKGKPKTTTLITADTAGRFTVSPENLETGQGGYLYMKPMGPPEFGPRISLDVPFQTIIQLMEHKETVYPLPGMEEKAEEKSFHPPTMDSRVFRLGEVVVKARGSQPFRDKYMGYLDSLAKLDMNTDFICHHPHHVLNCWEHKNDPRDLKPVEGKRYMVLLGKNNEILGADYPYHYFYGTGWIIYHYPKLTEEELLKRNNLSRIKGYYAYREFYQPDYDKETGDDTFPDARNTLLWAPSVITDEQGEATLQFFCSDINTGFTVEIEGISAAGVPGIQNLEFSVLKTKPSKGEQ